MASPGRWDKSSLMKPCTVHSVIPPQVAMILERDGLNYTADQNCDRPSARNRNVGPIQPLTCCLLQPAPRKRRIGARMQMFRELLFDGRIKLAQSPLLDGPLLMCKPCRSPSIQRPQCRYVRNRLSELTPEMAQNRSRHVFKRSQRRTRHTDKAQLKGSTDPMSRSECLADCAPIAII